MMARTGCDNRIMQRLRTVGLPTFHAKRGACQRARSRAGADDPGGMSDEGTERHGALVLDDGSEVHVDAKIDKKGDVHPERRRPVGDAGP